MHFLIFRHDKSPIMETENWCWCMAPEKASLNGVNLLCHFKMSLIVNIAASKQINVNFEIKIFKWDIWFRLQCVQRAENIMDNESRLKNI